MMRIACVQFSPKFMDVEANLASVEGYVRAADCDLLVFPELCLSGYFYTDIKSATASSQQLADEPILRLRRIAKECNIAIVIGFLERDGEKLYNSAIAIDRFGKICGHYRKVHLFYYETQIFSVGDLGFPVCEIEMRTGERLNLGIMICYDWRFPEAARSLVLGGAEVIAMPANIVTTTGMLLDTLRVRAFENKVILVFADRVGKEFGVVDGVELELVFVGKSAIINFNGEILASAPESKDTVIVAEVFPEATKLKNINNFNNILGDRQYKSYFKDSRE
ncbi:MAG: nitrilase-related carbon-nitrogen hydrolase [bacterium]